MKANTAFAFFTNEKIVNPGKTSSKGNTHSTGKNSSFDSLFKNLLKESQTQNTTPVKSKFGLHKNIKSFSSDSVQENIQPEAKTQISNLQTEDIPLKDGQKNNKAIKTKSLENQDDRNSIDVNQFQSIEIPAECITFDDQGKVQLNLESLPSGIKKKLGLEDDRSAGGQNKKSIDIQVVYLSKEEIESFVKQEKGLSNDSEEFDKRIETILNNKKETSEESELNETEQKLFAQQRIFFAQFNSSSVKESNDLSEKTGNSPAKGTGEENQTTAIKMSLRSELADEDSTKPSTESQEKKQTILQTNPSNPKWIAKESKNPGQPEIHKIQNAETKSTLNETENLNPDETKRSVESSKTTTIHSLKDLQTEEESQKEELSLDAKESVPSNKQPTLEETHRGKKSQTKENSHAVEEQKDTSKITTRLAETEANISTDTIGAAESILAESKIEDPETKTSFLQKNREIAGAVTAAMAQTVEVPQGSDIDIQTGEDTAKQNRLEMQKENRSEFDTKKLVLLVQANEDGEEAVVTHPKVVLLARSAAENKVISANKVVSANKVLKSQSSKTGEDNSQKVNLPKESSDFLKEASQITETERTPEIVPAEDKRAEQTKVDSRFKTLLASTEKSAQSTESKNQEKYLIQQQLQNNRNAAILEATNNPNPQPAQPAELNTKPETGALPNQSQSQQHSPQLSSASQAVPANAPATEQAPQSSMTQHYAEKVAEVQEAAAKQIVRGVQGSLGSERSHITMRLVPETLGRIHVQMTMENGALTAQITAQKESTQAMLQQSVNSLRSAFEEQGIKVDRLVVNKDTLDLKQQDLGRHEETHDRSSKNRSGFDQRTGHNSQNYNGKQNKQSNTPWSDRMTATDYFM